MLTGVTLREEAHEIVAWTLLAVVGFHIAAVLAMSFMTRDNLVGAMISGSKSPIRHPVGRDAHPPSAIGLAVALLILAAAAYGVRAYDPLAFTLRSVESFEHGEARQGRSGTSIENSEGAEDMDHEGSNTR